MLAFDILQRLRPLIETGDQLYMLDGGEKSVRVVGLVWVRVLACAVGIVLAGSFEVLANVGRDWRECTRSEDFALFGL